MKPLEEIDMSATPMLMRDENGKVSGVRWTDGGREAYTTIRPEVTHEKTELEIIYEALERKFLSDRFRGNDGRSKWLEYLESLDLKQVNFDRLMEDLYSGKLDKVAVRNPDGIGLDAILMDREFAKKILVMGDMP